ncbi:hypothetical protein MMC21_002835 [Puttea exsequens]|nr:hypothetical protein [Puttea exsequens]
MADLYDFALDRTHAAACRLNLQYYLWKEMLNYDIHPSIPVSQSDVIADVACGTGIWLIHVARELPNAKLDGFDVDLTRAPFKKSLPPNVTLREWNIFQDVPSDMVGKYDVVHVRLLILVIENSDPRRVVRNLLKLLKPGGYLQWDELDIVNMCVKKEDTNVQAPALEGLWNLCHADGKYDWSVHIPSFLIEEGFQGAKLESFGDRQDMARAFNDQHMLTMEEFATTMAKIGQKDMARNIQRLISDAFLEATYGATLCIPRVVCIARKEG